MFDKVYNLGSFPVTCPNCEAQQPYNLSDYPKDVLCKSCGCSFPLPEYENGEILYLFSAFLANNRPEASLKLKPLCLLLKKAAEENKPYIRLYAVKDPSENASFPLLALFAAPRDKTEEYSCLGTVKTW